MEIKITVKSIYGAVTVYPACDTARKFARIAGTKTLTIPALEHIRALGYQITEIHEDKLKGLTQ